MKKRCSLVCSKKLDSSKSYLMKNGKRYIFIEENDKM